MCPVCRVLEPLCSQVEGELKHNLGKIIVGDLIRKYLPQLWLFKTEQGKSTVSVDMQGNTKVIPGEFKPTDVSITIKFSDLEYIIKNRSPPQNPKYHIEFLTSKGETAFNYLKGRLGFQ